jgi:hypothetical protein
MENTHEKWLADKEKWTHAKTFSELCQLSWKYINDESLYFPCWSRTNGTKLRSF